MPVLTEKQAYQAMLLYLQELYRQTRSEELGALLGELSFLGDGSTADPAAWEDWLKQVRRVTASDFNPSETTLKLDPINTPAK